jgi:dethiobiotin synthetase
MNIPRIVVGGVTSGVGKTTITAAIMYALKKKGCKFNHSKLVQTLLILVITHT